VDRKNQFPGLNVVVLDILPGENVDVVGDAHKMSDFFPEGHFDFVYSVSVFEHLAMPWKVVCEMNRVMKPGGLGLVHSHQTIGMHDMPWDFYRFSDVAWSGLFNGHTGFEVLGSVMDDLQFVIPFLYKTEKEKAEQSAGFESSTVMFKKVGPCRVSWDVPLSGVVETAYPEE
jgi:ubiquinone/menaquinone biosynthesis C-methylase UbiE